MSPVFLYRESLVWRKGSTLYDADICRSLGYSNGGFHPFARDISEK